MSDKTNRLNEVFSRHYQDLVKWCRGRVRQDLGDPEDFVHSAYLRCSRHWSTEHASKVNEAAYLYRSVRWVVLDALRKHVRERDRAWRLPRPANEVPWSALRELIVGESLESLKGRESQVCSALLAGKTICQIQRDLNLTRGAIAVYLSRAKANLCRLLQISTGRLKPQNTRSSGVTPGPQRDASQQYQYLQNNKRKASL